MDPSVNIALPNEATALLDALVHAGHGAAVVGGAVRDAALGRALHDLDVVTSASPADVESACLDQWWCRRVFAVGERYGTVGVVLADGTVVEVSRLRGSVVDDEVSHGAANAVSTEAGSAQDFAHGYAVDAAHRDFTANALAARWPGMELLDPTGGLADLDARILRTPGDPIQRFAEDPLRVLRAARFVAELGFTIDPAAADALAAVAPDVSRIAVERVRDELTALLVAPHVEAGLSVLRDSGALAVVLPELTPLDGLAQPSFHDLDVLSHTIQAVGVIPPRPILRWAALLHDVGKAPARTVDEDGRIRFFRHAFIGAEIAEEICRRLRLSNADRVAIVHLVREHMRWGEVPLENLRAVDRAVRRLDLWADGASPPRRLVSAEDALELELADFAGTAHRAEAHDRRRALEEALRASRERGTRMPPAIPLSGRELIRELGLPEGPSVGAALRAISGAVAEGRVATTDRDGALEVAREAVRRLESNASHKDSATVRVTSAPSICEEDAGRNSAGTN